MNQTTGVKIAVCERTQRPMPRRLARLLDRYATASTLDELDNFEGELAAALQVDHVLCVWLDWVNEIAWSPRGAVAPRVAQLAWRAAGSGKPLRVGNTIVEPIGPSLAWAVLLVRGDPEILFAGHTLRAISRAVSILAPAIERVATL